MLLNKRKNIKLVARILPAIVFVLLAFVLGNNHADAAACVPGTGMATLTNTSITAPAAGSYKVWLRVASATPSAVKSRVEVTPSGGSPTCFDATNPSPNSTGWQWVNVGTTNFTASGNTVKIVGVDAGFRVDRFLIVAATTTCTPGNTRNISSNPIVEPGDNCIPASTSPTPSNGRSQLYRFWSQRFDNEHFFTVSTDEYTTLLSDSNWQYEGRSFSVDDCKSGSKQSVYRFWSPKFMNAHFFTISYSEYQTLLKDSNWKYEGVAYCADTTSSAGNTPVYRFWSQRFHNSHFYTSSYDEYQTLLKDSNWKYEGVAFYAW